MTKSPPKRATSAAVVAGLVAALALLAAGCGSSSDASGTESTVTETTPAKAIKVGLITDLGQLNDNGFNEGAYNGLKRAERVLGVKGRVIESASAADYIPNMSTLARQGYDVIIGVGYAQGDALATVAKKYPNTNFAIVDVDQATLKGKPANTLGLLFREEQVGYLAGYLAALEAKRSGSNKISAVAGFKEPPVDRYLAGYQAGAKAAVPGTVVKWGYSQDWDDQAKCKELALNQISAGSKVVFQVAGGCGLGALLAAKQQKVWGIGVDGDQSFLGPHVLTSALKGVDSAVFLTSKSVQDGTFKGGTNAVFGLDQDGVGLGKFSPLANEMDIAATKKIEQQIADGTITDIPTTLG
jgi:basic membrane protein A